MGGQNELRLYSQTYEEGFAIAQRAVNEVLRIEKTYSRYRSDSLIGLINAQAGKAKLELNEEAMHLFEVADLWYHSSNGLFDITSGVLRKIWNFQNGTQPSRAQIDKYLQLVDWSHVNFKQNEIGLPEIGMELDLGGIAKEFAVDRAVQVLQENNIKSGLVNLGGDLRILGPHLDGSPWPIQIAHPRIPGSMIATINIDQGALTTSGDYIRFIEIAGRRYCHILNPKTGWPVSYWQSVTVLAPLCLSAGYYSTITMLLEDAAQQNLERLQTKYLLVNPDGAVIQNLA